MPNNAGNNGPRVGAGSGRKRNTVVNNASKVPAPPVASASALGYGQQTAAARYGYLSQLAALRQNRAAVIGQFGTGLAAAKQQRLADVTGAANAAAERGLVGSSIDMSGRAGALDQFTATRAGLQQDKALGLLGVKQDRVGAQSDYYSSLADIASQRAVEQQNIANQNFQNNLYDSAQSNYQDLYKKFLAALTASKSGSAPRTRTGLTPTRPAGHVPGQSYAATPYTNQYSAAHNGVPYYGQV